jgi:hypothetical protein
MMRMTSEECSLCSSAIFMIELNLLCVIHPLSKLVTPKNEPVSFSFEDHAGVNRLSYFDCP